MEQQRRSSTDCSQRQQVSSIELPKTECNPEANISKSPLQPPTEPYGHPPLNVSPYSLLHNPCVVGTGYWPRQSPLHPVLRASNSAQTIDVGAANTHSCCYTQFSHEPINSYVLPHSGGGATIFYATNQPSVAPFNAATYVVAAPPQHFYVSGQDRVPPLDSQLLQLGPNWNCPTSLMPYKTDAGSVNNGCALHGNVHFSSASCPFMLTSQQPPQSDASVTHRPVFDTPHSVDFGSPANCPQQRDREPKETDKNDPYAKADFNYCSSNASTFDSLSCSDDGFHLNHADRLIYRSAPTTPWLSRRRSSNAEQHTGLQPVAGTKLETNVSRFQATRTNTEARANNDSTPSEGSLFVAKEVVKPIFADQANAKLEVTGRNNETSPRQRASVRMDIAMDDNKDSCVGNISPPRRKPEGTAFTIEFSDNSAARKTGNLKRLSRKEAKDVTDVSSEANRFASKNSEHCVPLRPAPDSYSSLRTTQTTGSCTASSSVVGPPYESKKYLLDRMLQGVFATESVACASSDSTVPFDGDSLKVSRQRESDNLSDAGTYVIDSDDVANIDDVLENHQPYSDAYTKSEICSSATVSPDNEEAVRAKIPDCEPLRKNVSYTIGGSENATNKPLLSNRSICEQKQQPKTPSVGGARLKDRYSVDSVISATASSSSAPAHSAHWTKQLSNEQPQQLLKRAGSVRGTILPPAQSSSASTFVRSQARNDGGRYSMRASALSGDSATASAAKSQALLTKESEKLAGWLRRKTYTPLKPNSAKQQKSGIAAAAIPPQCLSSRSKSFHYGAPVSAKAVAATSGCEPKISVQSSSSRWFDDNSIRRRDQNDVDSIPSQYDAIAAFSHKIAEGLEKLTVNAADNSNTNLSINKPENISTTSLDAVSRQLLDSASKALLYIRKLGKSSVVDALIQNLEDSGAVVTDLDTEIYRRLQRANQAYLAVNNVLEKMYYSINDQTT